VHVKDEYDYELISEDRELIFKHLIDTYKKVTMNDISIYGVHGALSHYIT